MKEYRIVCKRETIDPDGSHEVRDNMCVVICRPHQFITYDKEKAEAQFHRLIEEVEEHEAFLERLHANEPHFKIKQTNIRIQCRDVTEWEDALL